MNRIITIKVGMAETETISSGSESDHSGSDGDSLVIMENITSAVESLQPALDSMDTRLKAISQKVAEHEDDFLAQMVVPVSDEMKELWKGLDDTSVQGALKALFQKRTGTFSEMVMALISGTA